MKCKIGMLLGVECSGELIDNTANCDCYFPREKVHKRIDEIENEFVPTTDMIAKINELIKAWNDSL